MEASQNLASGDLRGSEQSYYSSVRRSSFGSKASSFNYLSKNHGAINSVEALGRLGRSEELKNNLYSYHPNLVGHTSMEKPVQNDINHEPEKRNSVVNGLHRIGIEGLARFPIPVISENNSLHAMKQTSEFMNSTSNGQGKNVFSQLCSNDIKIPGNSGNASFSDVPLGPKNFFRHDNNSSQSNSSNEAFGVERCGSGLSLGQPSQHKHSSESFSSTAMNLPLQNACWSRKFQQQNQLSDKNDCVREVKRARLNEPYTLIEASSTDRGPVPAGFRTITPLHNSESEDLLTYAKKDSSISLFLSHLTGGTGLLDISNKPHEGISSMTSSVQYDLLSSKEISSLHTGNEIREAGKAPSFNEFDYFNVKGNPSIVIADNGCNIVGSKINNKQIDDSGVGPSFISGQRFHHCTAGMAKSCLFSSKSLRSLHPGTNAENSNKQGNLFTIDDPCLHNHVVHGSEIGASHWTGLSDCRDSEALLTCSSINSNYISETSCSSCKHDLKFSDHLMDGNLRGLVSARNESLMAKHKQLSSSFKMKQHGRLCCHSAVPHQNSCSDFLVEQKDVNYCEIHKNASDLYSLANCDCNNHFGASHCKCGSAASNKCCSFAASTQSKTPSSAFSSYHVCCSDHHFCFRPRDILIDTSLDNVQHEMCIHKAGNHPVSGNCCCAIISNCQSVGCSSGGPVSAAHTINDPSVNGKLKRLNTTLDVDEAFQKERMVGLDQCSCSKKMAVMQNNCQTGFWRDVSGKIIGYSAAPPDNLVKASEVPRVDRLIGTASKKSGTTFESSTSLDEGQMSNCSGSSAPVITEVSVEVNKKQAQVSNIDTITILNYSEFDEGSAVEKCSSSVEMIDTGKYKEVPDTFCRVIASKSRRDHMPSHSSANIMNELKIRGSSNQKSARNKIGTLTDQENNYRRAQLTSVRELGNRKVSSIPFMLDKTFSRSVFHFAPSRPLDSVVEAKCIQSSKRDGVSMHPENAVESTDVVPSGSLNMKRKISDYTYPKFKSLKKLGNQNLQLKNSKQPTDKSKFSLAMTEKVNFTLHKKRHSYQRLNYLNGERPPKYVSLSSIVDSRNDETEPSTISKRPVVCGNSGIISSGERNALQKPAKIVPLNLVLKKARRCRSNWEIKHKISLFSKLESADGKDLRCSELSSFKSPDDIGNTYFGISDVGSGKLSMPGTESQFSDLVIGKAIKGTWYASIRSRSISKNKVNISEQWQMNRRSRSVPFSVDGEALCCICGSSNQEEINCLLECNQCMIRVHQACYGISKFPQDLWYCRPCKTNSQNIA